MKSIINLVGSILFFCASVNAQQTFTAEATRGGGSQELTVTTPSGKVVTLKGNGNEDLQNQYLQVIKDNQSSQNIIKQEEPSLFISHQAVLLKDGTQEIRWTDATGKERVVTAMKGESIQEKYWAYLKKEGLPCGCTPPAASIPENQVKTVTRDNK